jgi:hypothetical protein
VKETSAKYLSNNIGQKNLRRGKMNKSLEVSKKNIKEKWVSTMKKLLAVLAVLVLMSTSTFAAEFTGFNVQLDIASITDIHLTGPTTGNMTEGDTDIAMPISVETNLANWGLVVNDDRGGLYNLAANHQIDLQVDIVAGTGAAGTYVALAASDVGATAKQITGRSYNTGTPSAFNVWLNAPDISDRRQGYYSTYINLKVVSE